MANIHPIGIEDAIHVRGKHLYKHDGTPFTVKGIAFPVPPGDDDMKHHGFGYNTTAWLAILKQLRVELGLDFNTVRMY